MNKNNKITFIIIASLLGLAGGGYGAWIAWDVGYLGNNPRAPVSIAMDSAVRKQAFYNTMLTKAAESCVRVNLSRPSPEIKGLPGIAFRAVPGQYYIALHQQTKIREQPARDIQLMQLNFLVEQGLLSASEITVMTEDLARKATSYYLTWVGYSSNQERGTDSLCLFSGRREFNRIEKIEKLLEKVMDFDVYEVTYLTKVTDVPEWTTTEEAKRLFPKLSELTTESRGITKVIRAKEGWLTAYEAEMEVRFATKSRPTGNYQKEMSKGVNRITPTLDEVKALVNATVADTGWATHNSIACMPLRLQRGGDDKEARRIRDATTFTVTYYDRGDRKKYDYRSMAKSLHILSALEAAGLAHMEQIKPQTTMRKNTRRDTVLQSKEDQKTGIRYHVSREAIEALELRSGGGCVPAGRLRVEALAVHDYPREVKLLTRGIVEQTPEWAAKIANRLPALKTLIETGLSMSGQLTQVIDEPPGKWRLAKLSPTYPEIKYSDIPAYLVPLMPHTAAAFPAKPVNAKAIISQGTTNHLSARSTSAKDSPAPELVVSQRTKRLPVQVNSERSTSIQPPYPVGNAPVHVVSIYEAPLSGGRKRGFQEHPEGVVDISVNEPNAVLLLYSYGPTEWRINVAKGIKLSRVIVTGIYDQRVTLQGGGEPQVDDTRFNMAARQIIVSLRNGFPVRQGTNNLVDIANITRTLTGVLPRSFQAASMAPASGFTIDLQTPRFVLPERKSPGGIVGTVVLRSAFHDAVNGNRLLRGPAGAYTVAWSDRAYSSGKVYFEGEMNVIGALAAHVHANIGQCIARDNFIEETFSNNALTISHKGQKLYKDGDLFGVATDFDRQRMYYSVNGKWITGAPGSNNGIQLQKDKDYRACVFAAGTTSGEEQRGGVRSDTTWKVNFGAMPFENPLPSGYAPYQGNT